MTLKKGQEVVLKIETAAFKGKGLAKHDGLAVFVPNTAPGDTVKARITRKKKNYREAKVIEYLEYSDKRIDPVCTHARVCGGCTWQHLPYSEQLSIKEQHVRDHMERIAGLDASIVDPILGCDQDLYYRNKMEYSFGTRRWLTEEEIRSDEYVDDSGFAAGLHAPGRYDKILNLSECHLQDPLSFSILDFIRAYCIEQNIQAFDTHKKTGLMRNLVIRNSHYRDDLMVNIVTYRDEPEIMHKMTDKLRSEFPQITTIVNNVNDQPNPTATGRFEHVLYGPGTITDKIGDHTFQIDANAFFQTNTAQAEKLYGVAAEFASESENKLLFDLYCGVGTLTLYLSDRFEKVVGVELVDVAVKNATENAHRNGIEHVTFELGDMKETFNHDFLTRHGHPNCVVTDPPRAGMHPDVVKHLSDLNLNTLVYVSCNPATMARDLKILKETYDIERVQPVDMFPQTYHIEAVALCRGQ